MNENYGYNLNRPVMYVLHRQMKRATGDSLYRTECARCPTGVLLVMRDRETLELAADDNCIVCGQRYRYLDIEELRMKIYRK